MIIVAAQAVAQAQEAVKATTADVIMQAEKVAPTVTPILSTEGQMAKVTIALVFVLAIIYFFAWLIRKNQGLRSFVGQPFKTLAMSSVGPKERIALIEIGDKQILLGITPSNINTLATFDEPVMQVKDKAETDFAKKLKDIMSHGRAD